jgi:hypothetical protein
MSDSRLIDDLKLRARIRAYRRSLGNEVLFLACEAGAQVSRSRPARDQERYDAFARDLEALGFSPDQITEATNSPDVDLDVEKAIDFLG